MRNLDRLLPSVIAHRGAPRYVPENTLAGLEKAKAVGATWVEFDVMLSADGVAVIMHDATLGRTTNGSGRVCDHTYAELQELDAGNGEKIPTFNAWIAKAAELGLGVNIEIKEKTHRARRVAKAINQALKKHWHIKLPTPLISSATFSCLEAYRKLDAMVPMAYITGRCLWGCMAKLEKIGASALVMDYHGINAKRLEILHSRGYKVLTYTVNDPEVAKHLFELGVDSVFTDDLLKVQAPNAVTQN